MNLKLTTARNSMLMGGILFLTRPLNIIVSIFLARLLEPEEFGLVTLAMVLIQSLNLFTNLGMDKAIIHSRDEPRKVAFQSFLVVTVMSALFTGLIMANSNYLATWLGDDRTAAVLRWSCAIILLNGLMVVPTSLMRKELQFNYIALMSLASSLLYAFTSVMFAYFGFGIWSIIYANLLSVILSTILSWWWSPGWSWLIPSPWDHAVMKRLMLYGGQVCGSGLISYFHTNWDDWLVGRVLGVAPLGFYSKAYDFSNATVGQFLQNTIGMVFLPSYTKIQDEPQRLIRAYLKTVRLVFLLVVPIALGITVVAAPLVQVLFSAKWLPMVAVLQIFALLILTRPISENTAPLFQAVGRPSANTRAAFVLLAVMVPSVLYLLPRGIEGVAVGVAVSHLVGALYNVYQVNRIFPGTAKSTGKIVAPILFSGIVMAFCVQLVKTTIAVYFGGLFGLLTLFSLVVTGIIVYSLLLFITQKELMFELLQVFSAFLPKRFQRGAANV